MTTQIKRELDDTMARLIEARRARRISDADYERQRVAAQILATERLAKVMAGTIGDLA